MDSSNPFDPMDSSNPFDPMDPRNHPRNPFNPMDPTNPFDSSEASDSRNPSPTSRTLEGGNDMGLREDICRCGQCVMCEVNAIVESTQPYRKRLSDVHDRIPAGDSEDTRETPPLPGSPDSASSEGSNTPLPL